MFFDQLDERNAMMKITLAFEKVGKVGLADLGSRLWLGQPLEKLFSLSMLQM